MTRKECLDKAAECVLQNRQDQYGDAEDCFKQISRLWSAYLAPAGVVLESFDVACMMALLKIARIQANPKHGDSWVDLAGYAACGADIAVPEPFRYDKPKAEGGCRQNGNDQPEFKTGDAVEWNSIGKSWCPAVYEREFGDFGHCAVRLPDGRERIVSKVDLRKAEANYPENPDSSAEAEPGFKPGDRAQAFNGEEWVDCRYIRWNEPEGKHVVQYKGCRCSIDPESLRPMPRAEGCEAFVEHDAPEEPEGNHPENPDSSAEAEPGFKRGDKVQYRVVLPSVSDSLWRDGVYVRYDKNTFRPHVVHAEDATLLALNDEDIRPAPKAEGVEELVQKDAPQTPQELYNRIIANNPATYGSPHKPTGEELAEMAEEEEKHG